VWEQALWILVSIIGFVIVLLPGIKSKNLRMAANWIGIVTFCISWFWMPFTTQPKMSGLLGMVLSGGGIALFIFGMIFAVMAAKKIFQVVGRAGHAEPTSLVIDGPYRIVRHPIYCGLFLAMLGWSLAWGGVYATFLMPLLYLLFRIEARIEERQVEKKFGDQYVAYREKTPAFFSVILAIPPILVIISIIVGIWLGQIPLV